MIAKSLISAHHDPALICQPIHTEDGATAGCELILDNQNGSQATAQRGSPQTASLLWSTLYEQGYSSSNLKQNVFVRTDRPLLESAGLNLLPREALTLKLDFSGLPDKRLIDRCRTLRERGFSLALANYSGIDDRSQALLSLLNVVEINLLNCNAKELHELAASLSRLPIKLLANGIDSGDQLALCQQLGFNYFQGIHLAPAVSMGKQHYPLSRASLLALIELVNNRADVVAIESALKKDTALLYHLLYLSLNFKEDASTSPWTLRSMLTSIGTYRLGEWLQGHLEGVENDLTDRPSLLTYKLAALRGRILELLAQKIEPNNARLSDSAYLAGCLSTTRDASIYSSSTDSERSGLLGQLLDILELFDNHDQVACQQKIQHISKGKLHYSALTESFEHAVNWLTRA